jgi:glutamine synthetase
VVRRDRDGHHLHRIERRTGPHLRVLPKYKLEYIWLDGKKPVPGLRGKTLIKAFENPPTLADLPNWGFDGSSTMQAEGKSSDCVLKPVALYPDGAARTGISFLAK